MSLTGDVVEGELRADLGAVAAPRRLRRHRTPPPSCTPTRRGRPRSRACSTSCRCCTTSSCCSAARSGWRPTPPSARRSCAAHVRDGARRPAGRADGQPRLGRRRRLARRRPSSTRCCSSGWPRCTTAPSALGTPRVLTDAGAGGRGRSPRCRRSYGTVNRQETRMKVAAVGVHVLDTHVIGIESIPDGSDGQVVETIRMSPAGTAGGTAVVLARLGAEVLVVRRGRHRPDRRRAARPARRARASTSTGLVRKPDHQTSASVHPGAAERRPAGLALHRRQRRVHPRRPDRRARRDRPPPPRRPGVPRRRGRRPAAGPGRRSRARPPRSTSSRRATPTCWRGSPTRCRTPTTCCPTTSRCSASPARRRSPRARGALVERGVGCVAVTQGAKGALVVTADEVDRGAGVRRSRSSTPPAAVTRSRPASCAASSLGRDLPPRRRLGCATAAQVAQGLGTDAGSYSLATVQAFEREAATR